MLPLTWEKNIWICVGSVFVPCISHFASTSTFLLWLMCVIHYFEAISMHIILLHIYLYREIVPETVFESLILRRAKHVSLFWRPLCTETHSNWQYECLESYRFDVGYQSFFFVLLTLEYSVFFKRINENDAYFFFDCI